MRRFSSYFLAQAPYPSRWLINLPLRVAFSPDRLSFLVEGVAKAALHCPHRACAFCEQEGHLAVPLPSYSPQEWHQCWSHCGRRARLLMIPPSSLVISQRWVLIDLPLRKIPFLDRGFHMMIEMREGSIETPFVLIPLGISGRQCFQDCHEPEHLLSSLRYFNK